MLVYNYFTYTTLMSNSQIQITASLKILPNSNSYTHENQ